MPVYEYKCQKCGLEFEAIQKITEKPLKRCKVCSGKVARLISNSSFVLKGSGWYVTDYARKEEAKSSPADSVPKAPKEEEKGPTKEKGPSPEA